MIGKVKITVVGKLPSDIHDRIQKGVDTLESNNVNTVVEEVHKTDKPEILIEVIETGEISDKEVREFLSVLLPKKREIKNTVVKLADDEKCFELPKQCEECVDWFIRE